MTETWSWIDADGVVWSMNNFAQGIEVIEGVARRYMPPIRRVRDVVAGQPGSRLRDVKHDLRSQLVPVLVRASTESAKEQLLRQWTRRFDPARGSGILEVSTALGDLRRLSCIYAEGLEVVEDESSRFPGAQKAVLTFEADDPYWYDVTGQSVRFSPTTTAPTWFPGGVMLPIMLGSSAVFGGASVDALSNVNVWPVWTITGPGTNIVLQNATTGEELIWNNALTAGQILTIDTRPGVKTVLREDASNQFDSLTAYQLWALVPGINSITVSMTGTTGASSIVAAWTPAHLTP